MRPLSKSKILAGRQCHKKLWLEVYRPELKEDSAQTQASFETGHKVGEVAQHIYDPEGTGVLIDPFRDGFDVAIAQTNELLQGCAPIFEAVFSTQGGLALADVMLRVETGQGSVWRMVEVKSATSVKPYYLEDVAVQGYLAKASNVELESIQLAHIDNRWTYAGDGNYQGLLKEVDLTAEARAREANVKNWIKQGQQVIARSAEPDIAMGPHCNDPHACGFQEYCGGDEPAAENPVYWLPNIRSNALKAYIAEHDVTDMAEIPDKLLNKQQLMVKTHTLSGATFFDVETTSAQLAQYPFPAYFLDFESVQFAVPIWKGTRPYAQLVVQFSLHILDGKGVLSHEEFLDISGQDPRRELALHLVDTCGCSGPVFVYSAQFERGRINELAECFADLAVQLKAINKRLVDLLPIARECYYHPGQQGSWSIKSVLPAIAPELNYADLDGVQDGGGAVVAFQEAVDAKTTMERKQEIEQQLLKYCMLDTFAMVVMWKRFAASEFSLPLWTEL